MTRETMKRIIILEEPAITEYDISLKAGKRLMNRFCIDENAGFELSGVYSSYLSSIPRPITSNIGSKIKGKMNFVIHRINAVTSMLMTEIGDG